MCNELIEEGERLAPEPHAWENPTRLADYIRLLRGMDSEPGHTKAMRERIRAAIAHLEAAKVRPGVFLGSSARPI